MTFPKGRIGNACKKLYTKVQSLIMGLRTPTWRSVLKESSIRGLRRSSAGCAADLQKGEFSNLIEINDQCMANLEQLLDLCLAEVKFQKDEQIANIVRFKVPLETLVSALHAVSATFTLDAELFVLLAHIAKLLRGLAL